MLQMTKKVAEENAGKESLIDLFALPVPTG
jgi:hypothetical protein